MFRYFPRCFKAFERLSFEQKSSDMHTLVKIQARWTTKRNTNATRNTKYGLDRTKKGEGETLPP